MAGIPSTGQSNTIGLQSITARLMALWALLSFLGTFLLFFIPAMFTYCWPEPKSSILFTRIARLWMDIWLPLVGCPLTLSGTEHFTKGQTYIITCNHNSLLDVPLSSPYIPGGNKTIAKKSLSKIPIFGQFYRKGAVLVDRKSEASRKESYQRMKATLEKGIHMCIYPEGTRNKTSQPLAPFHLGAFRLAVETQTPVIPAIILHTREALPADRFFYFRPRRLALHFLPPVHPKPGKEATALKDEVYAQMHQFLEKNNSL
ncbi:MAG: lysophospholipid acyltransferase family protein [Chitinophagaceae bacterium]